MKMWKSRKPTIEYLTKTKEDAMLLLTKAEEAESRLKLDIGVYKMVISECDTEVARQQQEKRDVKAAKGYVRTRVLQAVVAVNIFVLILILAQGVSICQWLRAGCQGIRWRYYLDGRWLIEESKK